MKDESSNSEKIQKTLDEIKKLLQHSLAIQLYRSGATQHEISKNLKIATRTINHMVKGMKKDVRKSLDEKS